MHFKRRYLITESIEDALDSEQYIRSKYGLTNVNTNDDFFECALRYKGSVEYL